MTKYLVYKHQGNLDRVYVNSGFYEIQKQRLKATSCLCKVACKKKGKKSMFHSLLEVVCLLRAVPVLIPWLNEYKPAVQTSHFHLANLFQTFQCMSVFCCINTSSLARMEIVSGAPEAKGFKALTMNCIIRGSGPAGDLCCMFFFPSSLICPHSLTSLSCQSCYEAMKAH